MPVLGFDHLYATAGWLSPGYVSIDADGWITDVSGDPPDGNAMSRPGIAIPGVPNLHSHAFQRGMAGLSEYRTTAAQDSF